MCLLLAFPASSCGSHSRRVELGSGQSNRPQPQQPGGQPATDAAAHSRLISQLPALSGKPAGTEFEFTLRATLTEPVFQGSARIVYDSSVVEPMAAVHGSSLPSGEVVLARTDAAPGTLALSDVDRPAGFDGCVPFAFTARPGGASLTPGGAELLRVKFRLKSGNPDGIPVRIQNDPQFLQLRNARGQRVAFDLDREAAAR